MVARLASRVRYIVTPSQEKNVKRLRSKDERASAAATLCWERSAAMKCTESGNDTPPSLIRSILSACVAGKSISKICRSAENAGRRNAKLSKPAPIRTYCRIPCDTAASKASSAYRAQHASAPSQVQSCWVLAFPPVSSKLGAISHDVRGVIYLTRSG